MRAGAPWQPAPGPLLTRWAADVDPACPLPEYPRPQLVRDEWVNLNGLWDYAIVPAAQEQVDRFDGRILVPFAVESALSGVGRPLLPDQRLWYRRTFANPLPGGDGLVRRVLLHFGAVDYRCDVWVNGRLAGAHTGGYLPFTFDITHLLFKGENELSVAVSDPSDTGEQPYGKQSLRPRQIWYTAVSGIWQTVWLEVVPECYVAGLTITPDLDAKRVSADVVLFGDKGPSTAARIAVYDDGAPVAVGIALPGEPAVVTIPTPRPWSPGDPHLYDLRVETGEDCVVSYFAMRKFSLAPASDGHIRFHLNNQPLFLFGPLDQGYWPDGLYTAPTDAALRSDLEYCKRIGANLVRKHVKVEPLRWYYHCDHLGLIVWQDMPNGGRPVSGLTTLLALAFEGAGRASRPDRKWGRKDAAQEQQFTAELTDMVEHLYNAPCIAAWVPFNEGWGQFDAVDATRRIKALDPTRAVDHASGWFDEGSGDFCSRHIYYFRARRPRRSAGRAFALTEFAGYGLLVPGHAWDPKRKFSVRFFRTPTALQEAYGRLLENELRPLIAQGLMAAVFTQLADVEIEVNGWLTYDREVEKLPAELLAALHKSLIASK